MPDPGSPFAPYRPSAQRGEALVALVLAEAVEKDVYELAELQVGVWKRAPETWCFISAENMASLDLHYALGFTEIRRGPRIQGVAFDRGEGVLLRAQRPEGA
jgi:hypothetical protein